MSNLRLAIAADFSLAEKLVEALEKTELAYELIEAVELQSFNEEQALRFNGKSVNQITLDEVNWQAYTHVLFGGNAIYAEHLAAAVQAGCIVLDLYGIAALIQNVPVVVPSVNDDALTGLREHNIVSLANPQISQIALSLKPFIDQPINRLFVSSLLPASYFGDEKIQQLAGQTARLLNGINLDDEQERVAFDNVPADVQADQKSLPFVKFAELQFAKVFPNLNIDFVLHSIQTPVFYGLAQMVEIQADYGLDSEQLHQQWQNQAWLSYQSEQVITPVKNGENEEENKLQISRLLAKAENQLQYWTVADEQRFSLAFLAVELLKRVVNY